MQDVLKKALEVDFLDEDTTNEEMGRNANAIRGQVSWE